MGAAGFTKKPNATFISNIQVLLYYTSSKWTQGILIWTRDAN